MSDAEIDIDEIETILEDVPDPTSAVEEEDDWLNGKHLSDDEPEDALTFYSGIPKKSNFSYKIPKWAKVTSIYFISPLMYTP